jgi:hypothetical protein
MFIHGSEGEKQYIFGHLRDTSSYKNILANKVLDLKNKDMMKVFHVLLF